MSMDTLFLILIVLFLLMLLISDILVIKRIMRRNHNPTQRLSYILLVLLIPMLGISLYYMIEKR